MNLINTLKSLERMQLTKPKSNVEHFTINSKYEGLYNLSLDDYEKFRRTDINEDSYTGNMKKRLLSDEGIDLDALLVSIPKSDIDTFIRNFEKSNSILTTEQLQTKIKIMSVFSRYASVIIGLMKKDLIDKSDFDRDTRNYSYEMLDSINMIIDSIYKAALFEESKRKYMTFAKSEGFTNTEQESVDKMIIDLAACDFALKNTKVDCPVSPCPPCKEDNTMTYVYISIISVMLLVILYLALFR